MTERERLDNIHEDHPEVALFRNDNGYAVMGGEKTFNKDKTVDVIGGRWLPFGIDPGSGDLVGWTPVIVTQEMVGKHLAVFTSIEDKSEHDEIREDQYQWARRVREDGGIAKIVRTVGDERVEEAF